MENQDDAWHEENTSPKGRSPKMPTKKRPPALAALEGLRLAVYELAQSGMINERSIKPSYASIVWKLRAEGYLTGPAPDGRFGVAPFVQAAPELIRPPRPIKVTLPAKVEPEEKAAVEAFAARENINVSEAVRRIIRAQLMTDTAAPAAPVRQPHRRRKTN